MWNSFQEENRNNQNVLTVSQLNNAVKDCLEAQFFYCQVEGEVSNAAFPQSGHIYFNLKDDGSVIKAVIWRTQAVLYRGLIASGQKIKLTGKIGVYPPRGEYQFIASKVEEAGKGDLHQQFEQLKKKLEQEGLFDPRYKKTIPPHPRRVGLITSSTAAALQDVLNVFASHRPDIDLKLYNTRVQGAGAEHEIAAAIVRANQENDCDLLLVIRGGGSIEDLWAFNEEVVARAIFASSIPIITGVGHETDYTIADFVADLRAPTPSMAAKYSSLSRDELYQVLNDFRERLNRSIVRKIELMRYQVEGVSHRLMRKDPKVQLGIFKQQFERLKAELQYLVKRKQTQKDRDFTTLAQRLQPRYLLQKQTSYVQQSQQLSEQLSKRMLLKQQKKQAEFLQLVEKLSILSPLNILLRGYSMTTLEGKIVKTITQVAKGDLLTVQIPDGKIHTIVKEIEP